MVGNDETALLAAARAGDADAFGRLVGEHRAGLLAHCYRMLGSRQDAEDALQESLVRAWRGLSTFRDGSLRPWLYRRAADRGGVGPVTTRSKSWPTGTRPRGKQPTSTRSWHC